MDRSAKKRKIDIVKLIQSKRTTLTLGIIAGVLVVLTVVLLLVIPSGTEEPEATNPAETETTVATETVPETETTAATETAPTETERPMLPQMAELYAQNPDVYGYLKIADTVVDYPVMFTPDDELKYLYKNFNGKFSAAGSLLMDARCQIDPESVNLMIHGHNMNNGTMFKTLLYYSMNNYWKDHSEIQFTTLYEERTYEVVAAFFDRVYDSESENFKFYEFVNPADEETFNEGIEYFKKKSEFDSGITPEFGDRLLTLVTCDYSVPNGRFVLVARLKTAQ